MQPVSAGGDPTATVAQLRQTLLALCHRAYAFGLTPGVSGNMSVRVPGQDLVVIKATGYSLGDMSEAETLLVDLDGQVVEESGSRPSKEMHFHLAIYRRRPDVGAVVHLHPPYTLVFTATHGLPPYLTVGADLYQAFYITQYLEDTARTAILVKQWRGQES